MRRHNFLRAALCAFTLLFLFSCDREESRELESVALQKGPYSVDHVGLSDIPNVSRFLEKRAGKSIFSSIAKGDGTGAIFAIEFFDKTSDKTFAEQLEQYFINQLEASSPNTAPNYLELPQTDSKNKPTRTNETTTPVFTSENP